MDQDLLAITLTAYSLGELDPSQRAVIEELLAGNEDARGQVMRARACAKVVRELLPTDPDDVQPLTPAEYRQRRAQAAPAPAPAAPASAAAPAAAPVYIGQPSAPTSRPAPAAAVPAQPASGGIGGLTWILLGCCALLLALLLFTQTRKPSGASAQQELVQMTEQRDLLNKRVGELGKEVATAKTDLEAAKTTLGQLQTSGQASASALAAAQAAVESTAARLKAAEAKAAELLTRLESAQTRHDGFTAVHPGVAFGVPSGPGSQITAVTAALAAGQRPLPSQVDSADLVQALDYGYAKPAAGVPAALQVAAAACPWSPSHQLVRVALVAGEQPLDLARLRVEFNPQRIGNCRLLGWEGGGPAATSLPAGASLTLVYEVSAPSAQDPVQVLKANRAALVAKIGVLEQAKAAAPKGDAQLDLDLQVQAAKLDLKDLDLQITQVDKAPRPDTPHFIQPAQFVPGAGGELVQARFVAPDRVVAAAATQVSAFASADPALRAAAGAALLGQILRGSPHVGGAKLELAKQMGEGLGTPAGDTLKGWVDAAAALK